MINIYKNCNKHETGFTNVPFRLNSACVIQSVLRFKSVVITVTLAYISKIFPSESKIIQLLFSKSSILLNLIKTEVLIVIRKKIILK